MATYGSDQASISVDNSGGTPVDLTAYVTNFSDIVTSMTIEDSTPYGTDWEESVASGVKMMDEITIDGIFDDTASTGPDVVLNAVGDIRTLTVNPGGSNSKSVEAIIRSYKVIAKVKTKTKYQAILKPTGAVT